MEPVEKIIEKFCIFEDNLPRDGGRWPEYASTMILCFDRLENDIPDGYLWTFYQSAPIAFHGLDNLVSIMDDVMDQAQQPMPWAAHRHIKTQAVPHPDRKAIRSQQNSINIQKQLSFRSGKLATISVRVYTRQHATMQGALHLEENQTICFRSALELMYLLRELLRGN